jgi:hypothetical protein
MSAIGKTTVRRLRRVGLPVLLAVVLASCGAWAGADTKSNPSPQNTGAARAAPRRLLDGNGIGGVKFGQSPAIVAASLGRLFGPPVGAKQVPHGYIRAFCGFHWEVWDGLGAASDGRLFVAELEVWFRNSRFVGYTYFANNFQTDLNTWDQYASQPMMLATAKGLAVGDPLARGRRLYGRAFVLTTQMQGTPPDPRLLRLHVWEASTVSGQIEGGIGMTRLVEGAHRTPNRTLRHQGIFGIGAGVGPITPCKSGQAN